MSWSERLVCVSLSMAISVHAQSIPISVTNAETGGALFVMNSSIRAGDSTEIVVVLPRKGDSLVEWAVFAGSSVPAKEGPLPSNSSTVSIPVKLNGVGKYEPLLVLYDQNHQPVGTFSKSIEVVRSWTNDSLYLFVGPMTGATIAMLAGFLQVSRETRGKRREFEFLLKDFVESLRADPGGAEIPDWIRHPETSTWFRVLSAHRHRMLILQLRSAVMRWKRGEGAWEQVSAKLDGFGA